jgi:hypothetical protein
MKVATKGDKPDWFDRPANVVGVNVCRISGKLPNYGCTNVQAMDENGFIETKSMVYTDYFVKGTQPTTICPVHQTMFADASAPPPVSMPSGDRATLPPPPPQGTSGAVPPVTGGIVTGRAEETKSEDAKPDDKKKKGFWRRVFGGGDKKDEKKDPKKPGGGG